MPNTTNTQTVPAGAATQVVFDVPLIQRTGGIGEVLVDLMNDQMRNIRAGIREEFKKENLPPKTLEKILHSFVSLEGTKQPRRLEELQFPELSEKVVPVILKKLVDARLLRESEDGVYELVHDTLAAHLSQTRDKEDIAVDETVKMVKDASYFQDKTNRYLLGVELAQFEKYAQVIRAANRLTEKEWAFVKKSRSRERRRTLTRVGVFLVVLGVAVYMSILYTSYRFLQEDNADKVVELEANEKQLEKNQQLSRQTALALQNSQNDRTGAFKQLRNVQAAAGGDPLINRDLADQLTNKFLSEFSLFPFYNRGDQLAETIDEVVVEDHLRFFLGAAKDSPATFVKRTNFNDRKLKTSVEKKGFLAAPDQFNTYGKVRSIVLLKDGSTVLTGHRNGKVWKWDITSDEAPQLVHQFDSSYLIRDMALRGDHQLLVAVDSIVYDLDLRQKQPRARFLVGFNRPVKMLAANPRRPWQYAVVKENSPKIYLCNSNEGGIDREFYNDLSTVTSLAFSPDGRKMIAAYEEGEVAKLWDLRRPHIITTFKGHQALISTIAFSPDGRKVLTGSWDQTAILWTAKGETIKRLVGHKQRIHSVALSENNFAVTCSEDGDIKTWYLAPLAEQERVFEDSIRALAVSDKHEKIAFSLYGDKGFFYLWDWRENTLDTVRQPLNPADRPGDIVALAYTADGDHIAVASENTLTTLIGLNGRDPYEDYRGGYGGVPYTPSISAVDVNEQYVLIADRANNQVVLRDRKNPALFKVLSHPNQVLAAKFSPDDSRVLTGCEDGKAYLWDISVDPPVVRVLQGHYSKVVAVDFSPDGKYILTGSYDNTAHLYRLRRDLEGDISPTFKLEGISASYSGHTSDVNAVAFGHTFRDSIYRFVTVSADKSGKYWELRKDGSLYEMPSVMRHLDEVTVAGFLPGDSLIVTGSFDETIRVWKAQNINELIDRRVLGSAYIRNYLCRFTTWTLALC